ncbi:MAG: hypothetical protein CMJ77_05250 [Planctomycetaceae bacterium]|nr:hypothetical protein [Planctomycetaceae bacterium]
MMASRLRFELSVDHAFALEDKAPEDKAPMAAKKDRRSNITALRKHVATYSFNNRWRIRRR